MRLILTLLLAAVASPAVGQSSAILEHVTPMTAPDDFESEGFHDYFERVGRWDFAPDVLVGNFNYITLGSDGRFLAVDHFAQAVQYFAPDGDLIRELDVALCEPGFEGNLSRAAFLGDGTFVLIPDGGRQAFWFDRDGRCAGRYNYGAYLPKYALGVGTSLFTVGSIPPNHFIEEHSPDVVAVRQFGETNAFPVINGMIPGGGLHRDSAGRFYLGLTHDASYDVWNADGTSAGQIGQEPGYARLMERDLESMQTAFGEYMARTAKQNSIRVRSWLIEDDKLVNVFDNGYEPESSSRRLGMQVISTDGTVLTRDDILYGKGVVFLQAQDGLLYRMVVPDGQGDPYIVIYRIRK